MKIALIGSEELEKFQCFFDSDRTLTGSHEWNNHHFVINPKSGSYDAVVALQSMRPLFGQVTLLAPPSRVALMVLEPPNLLELPKAYDDQFYRVLSQNPRARPPRYIHGQSGHGWFVERSINDVLSDNVLPKTRIISTCTSRKLGHREYSRRVAFLEYCRTRLPFNLDWFGRGTDCPVDRKIDALGPYKYQIVIENSAYESYFTEKICDAFISDCHPFYWGCPNLEEYFPQAAFTRIDLSDFEGSCRKIISEIEQDAYARSQSARYTARKLCALEYNRYPTILNLLKKLPDSLPQNVTIWPHDHFEFSGRQRMRMRVRNITRSISAFSSLLGN